MEKNTCDAIIISCIDFRFQKYIREWTAKQFPDFKFDYVGDAGCSKNLKLVLNQIDISKRLHNIKKVVLIHHEDCGAYGKEGSKEIQIKDLHTSKEEINNKYKDITVQLYYLHLDGTFESIT